MKEQLHKESEPNSFWTLSGLYKSEMGEKSWIQHLCVLLGSTGGGELITLTEKNKPHSWKCMRESETYW